MFIYVCVWKKFEGRDVRLGEFFIFIYFLFFYLFYCVLWLYLVFYVLCAFVLCYKCTPCVFVYVCWSVHVSVCVCGWRLSGLI